MTPETRVKKALLKGFYQCYGKERAWHTAIVGGAVQKAGRPDFFFSALGSDAWVEVKANDNKLSKLQAIVFDRMVNAGQRVMVVTGILNEELPRRSKIAVINVLRYGSEDPVSSWNAVDLGQLENPFWRTVLGVYA